MPWYVPCAVPAEKLPKLDQIISTGGGGSALHAETCYTCVKLFVFTKIFLDFTKATLY